MTEERLKLTGAFRTMNDWPNLQPGDAVDEELQSYFLEVLHPRWFTNHLIQIGEAHDHRGPNGAPRFATIQRLLKERWIYTGVRPAGERVTLIIDAD